MDNKNPLVDPLKRGLAEMEYRLLYSWNSKDRPIPWGCIEIYKFQNDLDGLYVFLDSPSFKVTEVRIKMWHWFSASFETKDGKHGFKVLYDPGNLRGYKWIVHNGIKYSEKFCYDYERYRCQSFYDVKKLISHLKKN